VATLRSFLAAPSCETRQLGLWLLVEVVLPLADLADAAPLPPLIERFDAPLRALAAMRVLALLVALAEAKWFEEGVWYVDFRINLAAGRERRFTMEVHPEWAPIGAERMEELVDADFFAGCRFFRVVPGFVAQFGIHGKPAVSAEWRDKTIPDDNVTQSNIAYYVSYATSGADSRTTQMFINLVDNEQLDAMGFAPFARITTGLDTVDDIYSEHGEKPHQGYIQQDGNTYLKKNFPKLSYVVSATKRGTGAEYYAKVKAAKAGAKADL
jgi:cyclophilin family peptidyl-prolyl cis-trans isomerase